MTPKLFRRLNFSDVLLYGITSFAKDEATMLEKVDAMLRGGIDALQLRGYGGMDREMIALGRKLKDRCEKAGALFIVNNRVDVALATGADGVHLGHNDMPVGVARDILGHRKIIGASTHSLNQALDAQKAGADYVSCGPIWATPTKPGYPEVGLSLIGLYKAALRIPFVVIGSIDESTIDAVVRALFDASDPAEAAQRFREKVRLNRQQAAVRLEEKK